MNGTVVLPEFANMSTTEPSIDTGLAGDRRHQVGVMRFDVCLDRGSGADKATESREFVPDKLIVGRIL